MLEVNILETAYSWALFPSFTLILHLFIGRFRPCIFKVITVNYFKNYQESSLHFFCLCFVSLFLFSYVSVGLFVSFSEFWFDIYLSLCLYVKMYIQFIVYTIFCYIVFTLSCHCSRHYHMHI
jgi:hypothetical protein